MYEGKDTPTESSEIIKILSLIENQLRKVIRKTPEKEKDVQDGLENIFIGASLDSDFIREKVTIQYSTKSYIPDFIFEKIDTIVKLKLCKTPEKVKEIISEINDDIVAYKTKFANLIFVGYDLGMIRDQDLVKTNLQNNEQVIVRIVKH